MTHFIRQMLTLYKCFKYRHLIFFFFCNVAVRPSDIIKVNLKCYAVYVIKRRRGIGGCKSDTVELNFDR